MAKSKLVEIKTKATTQSVDDFILQIEDEQKRNDSTFILDLMKKTTKTEPKIWGSSIVGFGEVRYKSPTTGREVDWFKIGFSPRKANLSIYIPNNLHQFQEQLAKLGKHKTGSGCLYIQKLEDVDLKVLKELIQLSLKK